MIVILQIMENVGRPGLLPGKGARRGTHPSHVWANLTAGQNLASATATLLLSLSCPEPRHDCSERNRYCGRFCDSPFRLRLSDEQLPVSLDSRWNRLNGGATLHVEDAGNDALLGRRRVFAATLLAAPLCIFPLPRILSTTHVAAPLLFVRFPQWCL